MVNWANKQFAILEFTRAYDSSGQALRLVSQHKSDRYKRLLGKLQQHLPRWKGSIQTFTAGIRGTLRKREWHKALTDMGISASDHQDILQSVVSTSLTSLDSMFTARSSHQARVALPGTDPPAVGSRTSQPPPPTHPLPPSSGNPLRSAARAPV